jgi:prophage maintenance system killer protein
MLRTPITLTTGYTGTTTCQPPCSETPESKAIAALDDKSLFLTIFFGVGDFKEAHDELEEWLAAEMMNLSNEPFAGDSFLARLDAELLLNLTNELNQSLAKGKKDVDEVKLHAMTYVRAKRLSWTISAMLNDRGIPLPPGHVWRLAIESQFHKNGPLGFEDEKGYLAAMLAGFERMLSSLEAPLSVDLFVQLHDMSVRHVLTMKNDLFAAGMRDGNDVGFTLVRGYNLTSDGLEEFRSRYKDGPATGVRLPEINPFLNTENESQIGELVGASGSNSELRNAAAEIIADYFTKSNSDDKKIVLKAIAECLSKLEQFHFFNDGNARTIGSLILNKLLLQQGFGLCMLENLNRLDMYSVDEIVHEIEAGIQTAQCFLEPVPAHK